MQRLIKLALQYPMSIIVAFVAILFFSWLTIRTMKIDIFPTLGVPTIYVSDNFAGLSPQQIEGFVTSFYEYHFMYVTGVKSVESKSVQGASFIKIQFHEGTDMSQAMAEVIGEVSRAKAYMPEGALPPFIIRYDAGSVPIGQLVLSSATRSLTEIQNLALYYVRPIFSTLPGVSAPPPYGGNQKTVIVKLDPDKVIANNLTPDDVVKVILQSNTITPAGDLSTKNKTMITSQNTVVKDVKELGNVPLKTGSGSTIFMRDVANIYVGADVTSCYALVNGKRSIYIPVTKHHDASTWDVVQTVKAALPEMQAAIPEDIKVSYEFDQSGHVTNSIKTLTIEGLLGTLLTGLMVLIFLGDRRGALIVMITIPLSLLSALIFLKIFNQTLNTITLGGLAMSIGILVDEAAVTIENIHSHQEMGKPKLLAIWNACMELSQPKLLILLCILAVFVPAVFMKGVPASLFLPLSLSVGLAMLASFILSQTLVPVFSNWFLKELKPTTELSLPERHKNLKSRYRNWLNKQISFKKWTGPLFIIGSLMLVIATYSLIGTGIFPKIDTGQVQIRLRMPTGTRLERTEETTKNLFHLADSISHQNVEISSAFVGTTPASYPFSHIYIWTSGPQESVIKIDLKDDAGIQIERFKEEMRNAVAKNIPEAKISFEPGDIMEQVLNLGSDNPVEIAVLGKDLNESRKIAQNLENKLKSVNFLRDVQITTPLDYPTIKININRVKSGQLGLSVKEIGESTVPATSSTRFTHQNFWLDQKSGLAYLLQVEYPQYRMNNVEDLGAVPVGGKMGKPVYLRDVAIITKKKSPGEYTRLNQQRFITITANIFNTDLGSAVKRVKKTIASLGELPRGLKIKLRGQAELLTQIENELQKGLLIALIVVFLMLTIYFQSFKLSLIIISIIPAVIAGSLLFLLLTGKTLNLQSYMGTIMAVGVAVSNAILFITKAELYRNQIKLANYADEGALNRVRPILMTSIAMIAGMLPMALGIGKGGDQLSPLGIAVIGGLIFSTVSTLFFLPVVYSRIMGKNTFKNPSLDPEDINSEYYE